MIMRIYDRKRVFDEKTPDPWREYRDYLLFGNIPSIQEINKILPGINEIKAGSTANAPKADRNFMLMEYEDGAPAQWEELP